MRNLIHSHLVSLKNTHKHNDIRGGSELHTSLPTCQGSHAHARTHANRPQRSSSSPQTTRTTAGEESARINLSQGVGFQCYKKRGGGGVGYWMSQCTNEVSSGMLGTLARSSSCFFPGSQPPPTFVALPQSLSERAGRRPVQQLNAHFLSSTYHFENLNR